MYMYTPSGLSVPGHLDTISEPQRLCVLWQPRGRWCAGILEHISHCGECVRCPWDLGLVDVEGVSGSGAPLVALQACMLQGLISKAFLSLSLPISSAVSSPAWSSSLCSQCSFVFFLWLIFVCASVYVIDHLWLFPVLCSEGSWLITVLWTQLYSASLRSEANISVVLVGNTWWR